MACALRSLVSRSVAALAILSALTGCRASVASGLGDLLDHGRGGNDGFAARRLGRGDGLLAAIGLIEEPRIKLVGIDIIEAGLLKPVELGTACLGPDNALIVGRVRRDDIEAAERAAFLRTPIADPDDDAGSSKEVDDLVLLDQGRDEADLDLAGPFRENRAGSNVRRPCDVARPRHRH